MRHRTALVVLAVLVAACGDGNRSQPTPGSDAPPVTSAPSSEPVPTTAVPSTPPVTAPPTSVVESTAPPADEGVTLGAPAPALLPASPPDEIDWSTVGPGWLLIDHPWGYGGPYVEPATLDERGLYLVSPDGLVSGASALRTDGSRVVSASEDGRLVLLERYDPVCEAGCECPADAAVTSQAYGYALLDLSTTTLRPLVDPVAVSVCEPGVFVREVDFTVDGTGIWVSETWSTEAYRVERVRLSRVEIASGAWTTIVDEPVDVDQAAAPSTWGISTVELDDGRIIVTTRAGTRLLDRGGEPLRELAAPDTCELVRPWDANHVLARCTVPPGAYPAPPDVSPEECRTSGLWLIAIDGSPAQPLAIPLDERGFLSCWAGYADAAPLGDWLAVGVGGDGCSDDVVLISADGSVTPWMPADLATSCTEVLLGVRNGAWLLGASPESGDRGIYEVTPDGSTLIDLPSGEIIVL